MIRSWLRHPLLHFLLIGAALLAIRSLWTFPAQEQAAPVREPVAVTASRMAAMQADFSRRWGRPPSAQELSALISQSVDEEILYREARLLALDYGDPSVRRRLIEKMRLVGQPPARKPEELEREARQLGLDDDAVIRRLLIEKMRIVLAQAPGASPITEAELQQYLDRHRERFELPEELSFHHVFLSENQRGTRMRQDAKALRNRIAKLSPAAATGLSDPFLLGLNLRAWSKSRLIARFGKPFAEQVFMLPPQQWSQAIESPYGLHLVWVEARTAPRLPALASVRPQVIEGVRQERAEAQLAKGMERLRGLYEIRVDGAAALSKPATLAASP